MFPNIEKWLAGNRFFSIKDIIAETTPICGFGQILLFERNQQTEVAWDKMYKLKNKNRLSLKINKL